MKKLFIGFTIAVGLFSLFIVVNKLLTSSQKKDAKNENLESNKPFRKEIIKVEETDTLKIFYSNGNLKELAVLENNKRNGNFRAFYRQGTIKEQGRFDSGMKTGSWKQYDKSGKVESGAYFYKDKKVIELDPDDYDLRIYKYNYISIEIPVAWTVKDNYKNALLLAVKPKKQEDSFAPNINITHFKSRTHSLNQVVELNLADLKKNVDGFKFKEKNRLTINGNEAIQLIYFAKQKGFKLGAIATYVEHKENFYIITCLAEATGVHFVKYKDLFETITNSFQVKKRAMS